MTILADGDGVGELLGFLPIVIIAGLIFLGNLIRRKMEEAEADKQRRKATEGRHTPAAPARSAPRQTLPGSLREVIAQATATTETVREEPAPPPPRRRRRRPEPEPTPESPIAAARAQAPPPVAVASPARTVKQAPRTKVDLSTQEKLRQAIIYHEIFGLPKSLRTDGEDWDQA